MRIIEKCFGFQSVKTGAIFSTTDITQTCLFIFVGYIGDRAHRPPILSMMMPLIGISLVFFFAGSYFYFSPDSKLNEKNAATSNTTKGQLCQMDESPDKTNCEEDVENSGGNNSAYILLMVRALLIGIGGSSCISMIFSYINENINKEDSAAYIGR